MGRLYGDRLARLRSAWERREAVKVAAYTAGASQATVRVYFKRWRAAERAAEEFVNKVGDDLALIVALLVHDGAPRESISSPGLVEKWARSNSYPILASDATR